MASAQGIKWTGGQIVEPGIYNNLPIDTYHLANICDGVSISSSGLRTIFNQSPAHYWCDSPLNPMRAADDEKRHFAVGRAIHHLAMGMERFRESFDVAPETVRDDQGRKVKWSLRTNHAKAWVADCRKKNKDWITHDELEQIRGMSAALAANGFVVGAGVLSGFVERSGFWRDEETGVWLKIRPDVIPTHRGGEMVDLKTTAGVQITDLLRAIENFGYDQQFALMREVLRKLKMPFTAAALVFVEKKPPHCVRVVELSDDDLDVAESKNRHALRRFVACLKSGRWPGPGGESSDAEVLKLSEAARGRAENQLKKIREQEDYDRRAGTDFRL